MDIREALEQADKSLSAEPTSSTETTPETQPSTPVQTAPVEAPKPAAQRTRAEDGTFKKEAPKKVEAKATTAAPTEAKADEAPHGAAPVAAEAQGKGDGAAPLSAPSPQPVVKAPASWKPEAKEAFSKAPPEVQREVMRREAEISRVMQESAEARKLASSVRETLTPFEGLARANGMDPLKYAGSVMQTAATLHMGTPAQKAAVVAQLIGSYNIDVDAVNAVMQGQAPAAAQPAQPPQDVGQLVERAIQQRLAQATEARAVKAWQEFQATEPEFLETVQPMMRAILMAAGEEGRNMTYQEAYDMACRATPEVSSVVAQRKAAEATRAPQPVSPQARAAAVSVKSNPTAMPAGKAKGVRGAMEAAAKDLGL